MYNCDICGTTTQPNQPRLTVIEYRETVKQIPRVDPLGHKSFDTVKGREIVKEKQVCTKCKEGHDHGLPEVILRRNGPLGQSRVGNDAKLAALSDLTHVPIKPSADPPIKLMGKTIIVKDPGVIGYKEFPAGHNAKRMEQELTTHERGPAPIPTKKRKSTEELIADAEQPVEASRGKTRKGVRGNPPPLKRRKQQDRAK